MAESGKKDKLPYGKYSMAKKNRDEKETKKEKS